MKNLVVVSLFLFSLSAFAGGHEGPHWSYGGHSGPDHWSELSGDFKACAEGHSQSPIDLSWSKQKGHRNLKFHYKKGNFKIIDNGHTVQVNVPDGSYVTIDGHRFDLKQFHFHALSEHTFSGKHFPLEAHFVHKDSSGKLAVVGVMFSEGSENKILHDVFSHIPKKQNHEETVAMEFDPASLMPKQSTHYHYMGSLTTPPCSEGVNWTVLNTPVELSESQVAQFSAIYSGNNRPVQPLHGRKPANF